MKKRLYRSRSDRMICGVCGGIGAFFGIPGTVVRFLALVLFALSSGLVLILYLGVGATLPLEPCSAGGPDDAGGPAPGSGRGRFSRPGRREKGAFDTTHAQDVEYRPLSYKEEDYYRESRDAKDEDFGK